MTHPLVSEDSSPGKHKFGVNLYPCFPPLGHGMTFFLITTHDDCFWEAWNVCLSVSTGSFSGSFAELSPADHSPAARAPGSQGRGSPLPAV